MTQRTGKTPATNGSVSSKHETSQNIGKRKSLLRLAPGVVVFTALAIASAVFMYSVVTNAAIRDERTYHGIFDDVSGLREGSDVQVGGVTVGQVSGLDLQEDGQVKVTYSLERDIPISSTSTAIIRYKDLLGRRVLEIRPGKEKGKALSAGGTIPADQTVAALDLDQLYNGFGPLFEGLDAEKINALSASLIAVMQGQGENFESILNRTASLTDEVGDRDKAIGRLVDSLGAVLTTIERRTPATNRLVIELQRLATGLSGDRKVLGRALEGIAGSTAEITRLIAQARPGLRDDLRKLESLAQVVNKDGPMLNEFLQRAPGYHALVGRVGIYQSAFQFYLCGVQLRFEGAKDATVMTEMVRSQERRCQS